MPSDQTTRSPLATGRPSSSRQSPDGASDAVGPQLRVEQRGLIARHLGERTPLRGADVAVGRHHPDEARFLPELPLPDLDLARPQGQLLLTQQGLAQRPRQIPSSAKKSASMKSPPEAS